MERLLPTPYRLRLRGVVLKQQRHYALNFNNTNKNMQIIIELALSWMLRFSCNVTDHVASKGRTMRKDVIMSLFTGLFAEPNHKNQQSTQVGSLIYDKLRCSVGSFMFLPNHFPWWSLNMKFVTGEQTFIL
jgi:hypothetical protein